MGLLRIVIAASLLGSVMAQVPPRTFGPHEALLQRHCADCHDADAHKGGLDLERLRGGDAVDWLWGLSKMRERLLAGEMPPKDGEPLAAADRAALADWLGAQLLAGVPKLPVDPGRVTIRRLSRSEWRRSIADLFGVDTPLWHSLPADDLGYGFDNIGSALSFSTLHLEKYLAAAEDVAARAIDGEDPANPTVRRFEAEAMLLTAGPDVNRNGDVANFYTRATLAQKVELPRDGRYRLQITAGADQAGDEPARMVIACDGREVARFDVPERKLKQFSAELDLGGGRREFAVSFVNDFYQPDHPDPQRRDRNLRVDFVAITGPIDARPVPPQQRWLVTAMGGRGELPARARVVARELLLRTWRRPPANEEITRFSKLAEAAVAAGDSETLAFRGMVAAAVASPNFQFRIEPGAIEAAGNAAALSQYAMATRLSYLVWSSTPDEGLLAAARQNQLNGAGLRAQLDRLLQDPRADALAENFAAQWLELRNLAERTPDPTRFAEFDDALRHSMRRETEHLFLAVLRENRDVRDLLDCDFTFVDARLAKFYGLPGSFDDSFTRVQLPGAMRERGGILGHASIHLVTSNPRRTSPVKRGKWILDNLLGASPPPPPPGNDSLAEEDAAVASSRSLREVFAAHRARASCAACHERMDALGFALENYDAIGRFRDQDAGGPIDASGTLPDGRALNGLAALKQVLRDDVAFVRTLCHRLFVYGVGRELRPQDRLQLDHAVELARGIGPVTLRELLVIVVDSDAFRLRTAGR